MRLAKSGLKFNASIMICGPATGKKELEALVQAGPQITLGIHAAVNSEWDTLKWGPVGDMKRAKESGFVDAQGHFHANPNSMKSVPAEVVLAEVRAQIQRALDWGLPFVYLDEHMGFSWVHNLSEQLGALAKEFGMIYRPKVAGLKAGKTGDLVADWKVGLQAIQDDQPHLMVLHPVVDDESTRAYYHGSAKPGEISRSRQDELDALLSAQWRETLAQENVELITYRDLPSA